MFWVLFLGKKMRKKEQISEDFKRIERQVLKQDITPVEAQIQSLALLTEILVDLRTNLCAIQNCLPNSKLQNITPER